MARRRHNHVLVSGEAAKGYHKHVACASQANDDCWRTVQRDILLGFVLDPEGTCSGAHESIPAFLDLV